MLYCFGKRLVIFFGTRPECTRAFSKAGCWTLAALTSRLSKRHDQVVHLPFYYSQIPLGKRGAETKMAPKTRPIETFAAAVGKCSVEVFFII
jgi:hypothetical protein